MKRACVIGWPIEHSRSPLIHGYWLKHYGIAGSYSKQAVRPEDVHTFLRSLADNGYAGCNVTVPHKEAAFAAADEKDAAAVAVSAANTLWIDDGKLCATNTDTYGFMTYLGLSVPDWNETDAPVSVLGAGGAARAIVYGFLEAGVEEVRVFNRTRSRAEALARDFGPRVKVYDWAERGLHSRKCSVLVNTTTIGMNGVGSIGIDFHTFDTTCVVCDIVYVPLQTELIVRALGRGLRVVDGLGMLLHQAVPGFEKWFGVRPDVTPGLWEVLLADIEAETC